MNTKHTPGPWEVHPILAQVDAASDRLPVCQLLWPTSERTEQQTEANARLISAVPDLLDALVELERQADRSLDYRPEFRRAIASAHAAIAKATGSAA